jgi:hypothetical protein
MKGGRYPKPDGPMKKFMIQRDAYSGAMVPVNINGHKFEVPTGKVVEFPDPVLQVLMEDQRNATHQVIDVDAHDPDRGGRPHYQHERPQMRESEQVGYRVVLVDSE